MTAQEGCYGTKVSPGTVSNLNQKVYDRIEQWRSRPLERINKEIRRRTRVVGSFPDGRSALMLVAARLRHIAGTKGGSRRYLSMARLYELERMMEAV